MASQMDALQSFTLLADNIPQWITRLDDLVTKCEIQYERFTRITANGEVKLTRKKKHDSTESLRPERETAVPGTLARDEDAATAAAPVPHDLALLSSVPSPLDASDPLTAIHALHRKRRAGSDLSGGPCVQTPYRSKSMVIVYYDSEIQSAFEALVRNIAGARNNLRKGRNTATFKARMATIGMGPAAVPSVKGVGDFPILDPKMMLSSLGRSRPDRPSGTNATKGFEDADRDLDEAQSLCERAAHQFLRDGDSHTEIEGTRKRFLNCAAIAKVELERLRREDEAEKAQDKEDRAGETIPIGEPPPPKVEAETKQEKETKTRAVVNTAAKLGPPPLKQISFVGAGTIEIDDGSDTESLHIDLSAIRRTVRCARG